MSAPWAYIVQSDGFIHALEDRVGTIPDAPRIGFFRHVDLAWRQIHRASWAGIPPWQYEQGMAELDVEHLHRFGQRIYRERRPHVPLSLPIPPKKRSCDRHDDCERADDMARTHLSEHHAADHCYAGVWVLCRACRPRQ